MINKSVDDKLFDSILSQAFLEAAEQDLEEMPDEEVEYSPKYQKEERKKYNKMMRTSHFAPKKRAIGIGVKRVASVVLVIGVILSVVMLMTPTIRADFFNLATTFFEKYFFISIDEQDASYETEGYLFGYIPEDLVDVDVRESPAASRYIFTSADGERSATIKIQPVKNSSLQYDNEHTTVAEISVNGYRGYLITSNYSDISDIIWTDDTTLFSVRGNLSVGELTKIAENIVDSSQ